MSDVKTVSEYRSGAGGPASRLYDESFALLIEARDCIATQCTSGPTGLPLTYVLAVLQLTTRTLDAMAWLLARKAARDGEIEFETCAREFELHGAHLREEPGREGLPARLCTLLDRSLALHKRIARLDTRPDM
jgi:hypothetical protein